jgi:hypothetical protein
MTATALSGRSRARYVLPTHLSAAAASLASADATRTRRLARASRVEAGFLTERSADVPDIGLAALPPVTRPQVSATMFMNRVPAAGSRRPEPSLIQPCRPAAHRGAGRPGCSR